MCPALKWSDSHTFVIVSAFGLSDFYQSRHKNLIDNKSKNEKESDQSDSSRRARNELKFVA